LPAVGFMLGLDRVALLLERQGVSPPPAADRPEILTSLAAARQARRRGVRVRLTPGDKAR
jgi:hypothetical protein